jgi:hypothetical protein
LTLKVLNFLPDFIITQNHDHVKLFYLVIMGEPVL